MILFNKHIKVWSHKSKFIDIIDIIYSKAIIKIQRTCLLIKSKIEKIIL